MNVLEESIRALARPSEMSTRDRDRMWEGAQRLLDAPRPVVSSHVGRRVRRVALLALVVVALGGVAYGASETVRTAVTGRAIDAIDVFRGHPRSTPLASESDALLDVLETSRGTVERADGRELARASRGRVEAAVSAVPTTSNDLCLTIVVAVDGEAGPDGRGIACIGPLSATRPIGNIGANKSDAYRVIGGIALDDVERIEVFVDGGWEPVRMTNHAFVWIGRSPSSVPGAVRATMTDGRIAVITPV